jgi:NAD(P)H dehydrogenase (quinone)
LETGVLRNNRGDGKVAYVSREDCAAAAAAVLTGGAKHAGRAYDITGPELIGDLQLAELYTRIGGRPVTTQVVSDAQYTAELVAAGMPEFAAALVASFGAATRRGALEVLSTAVPDLTGRPATTLSAVLEGAVTRAVNRNAILNIDLPLLARRWMRRPHMLRRSCSQSDSCGPPKTWCSSS